MRNDRTDAKLAQQVKLHFFISAPRKMPFLRNIEKKEVGPVVQVVIKPVLRIKSDGRIHIAIIQLTLDNDILIGKNVFGMVEVDLEPQALILVEQEPQPVVVLRDLQLFME